MPDPVIDILARLKGFKLVAYLIVICLIIIGIANFTDALQKIYKFIKSSIVYFENRQLSDSELKKQSLDVAKQLILFVNERQGNEPLIDFQNWEEFTSRLIRYSEETQNMYFLDFAPTIAKLRGEFLKRRLRDKKLDMFYERPTNYIGLQTVSVKLAELANKLH